MKIGMKLIWHVTDCRCNPKKNWVDDIWVRLNDSNSEMTLGVKKHGKNKVQTVRPVPHSWVFVS